MPGKETLESKKNEAILRSTMLDLQFWKEMLEIGYQRGLASETAIAEAHALLKAYQNKKREMGIPSNSTEIEAIFDKSPKKVSTE